VAGKVVTFFDADDAGDKAVEKLRDALQAEYGPEWVKDKLTRRRPMAGKDANDLRVKGLI
jgi:DNA primase